MLNTEIFSLLLMAAPPVAQANGAVAQPNPILAMAPFFLMFMIFYFLLIRPQKKKQADLKKQIAAWKKGDHVVTTGGILGNIVGVKEKTVVLRVGEGDTKIEVLRSAIGNIIQKNEFN